MHNCTRRVPSVHGLRTWGQLLHWPNLSRSLVQGLGEGSLRKFFANFVRPGRDEEGDHGRGGRNERLRGTRRRVEGVLFTVRELILILQQGWSIRTWTTSARLQRDETYSGLQRSTKSLYIRLQVYPRIPRIKDSLILDYLSRFSGLDIFSGAEIHHHHNIGLSSFIVLGFRGHSRPIIQTMDFVHHDKTCQFIRVLTSGEYYQAIYDYSPKLPPKSFIHLLYQYRDNISWDPSLRLQATMPFLTIGDSRLPIIFCPLPSEPEYTLLDRFLQVLPSSK